MRHPSPGIRRHQRRRYLSGVQGRRSQTQAVGAKASLPVRPRVTESSPTCGGLPLEIDRLMSSRRMAKVAEALREIVSTVVLFELKDPRVRNVTVLRAEVAPDLRSAKIYVS